MAQDIRDIKKNITPEDLCSGLNPVLEDYIDAV